MERRAAGQPLFTIPLSQLSTANLAPRDKADASALANMMRNLGGSVGIALFRRSLTGEDCHADGRSAGRDRRSRNRQGAGADAGVRGEAYVSAYSDTFWIVSVGLIIGLCAIVLLRKSRPPKGPVEAH
jgi:DHA2 family multidrug resistance protein